MEQLKPCPFCGCEPINTSRKWIVRGEEELVYEICCPNCGCDKKGYDKNYVAYVWNRRVDSELEILRRMVDVGTKEYYKMAVALTGDWVAEKDEPEVYRRFAQEWREQAEKEFEKENSKGR